MSQLKKEVKFDLKVMLNKEKTKVLFAEANGDFVDVLLSFLTLPLGKVVKVLEKHYGDKAPVIGSLATLYKGLANLDGVHFWTEAGRQLLLNLRSFYEPQCFRLKLDIADTQPPECLVCENCSYSLVSFYDAAKCVKCWRMNCIMGKQIVKPEAGCGAFVKNTGSFIISDDLQIFPDLYDLMQIIGILRITDTDATELMNVTLGFTEIMDLFKASLFSPTPLSDIILARENHVNLATVKFEPATASSLAESFTRRNNVILKVIVQKSTNKLLYARGGEDFIDFLSSFLTIPLGKTEALLRKRTCFKGINNLYRSVASLIDGKFFVSSDTQLWLIGMNLPHGSISKNNIFLISEADCDLWYEQEDVLSSVNFPQGKGNYLKGPRTYTVADDLTVAPFCISSTISMLNDLNIPMSDIKEVELQIGFHEGIRILEASLTSTCVLTDALTVIWAPKIQPKQDHSV